MRLRVPIRGANNAILGYIRGKAYNGDLGTQAELLEDAGGGYEKSEDHDSA